MRKVAKNIIVVMALSVLIGYCVATEHEKSTISASQKTPNASAQVVDELLAEQINAAKNIVVAADRRKSASSSVLMMEFTLLNKNLFPVKDIHLVCQCYGPSGTIIGKNEKIIYEKIAAEKMITVTEINMGFIDTQTTGVSCSAVRVFDGTK